MGLDAQRGLVPWGEIALLAPRGQALLPVGAQGEIAIRVPWASEGYVQGGRLKRHPHAPSSTQAVPFLRTGDAGRLQTSARTSSLVLIQRLRKPIEVHRYVGRYTSGRLPVRLRFLIQPCEFEEALLLANPMATAAAALQGPHGQLFCVLASPEGSAAVLKSEPSWPVQPDVVRHVQHLPKSPAGKTLYYEIMRMFE